MLNSVSHPAPLSRRGHLLPAIAIAILLAGGCLALVLNQLQFSDAQEELRSAASGAALAAAQDLAGDDLLKLNFDPQIPTNRARESVERVALSYIRPNEPSPQLEPRFGKVVINPRNGEQTFLETDYSPTSVQVAAYRDRRHGNGVATFAPYITGQSSGDVVAIAEASLTNLILGVRPVAAAGVPAWPLGVLENSADPRVPSWTMQITQRLGADNYGWDAENHKLLEQPDGLPEIVLKPRSDNSVGNVVLVDLGRGLREDVLESQFQDGWKADDLTRLGGEFLLDRGPIALGSQDQLSNAVEGWLEKQIGQPRIFVLYAPSTKPNAVSATQLVSGRLLKLEKVDGQLQLVLQPAVVATRMAVLDEDALWSGATQGNPYIYKVSLTR